MVRFIVHATIGTSDLTSFQIPFNVPGSGFFRNLTVSFKSPTTGRFVAHFGKVNADNMAQLPTPDDTFSVVQGRSSKTLQVWGPSTERLTDPSLSVANSNVVLRRHRELYCKNDELYAFRMETAEFSEKLYILIEAEYVLYNDSLVKHQWHFNELTNASDFNLKYQIPYALKNATLRMYGRVTSATGDSGVLVARVLDKDDIFPDAVANVQGLGAFDASILTGGDSIPANNLYSVHIGSQETGLAPFDRTFPIVKYVHPGDGISFDILQPTGTFTSGDLELYVEITGRSLYSRRNSFKANYRSGLYYNMEVFN